MYVDQIYTMMRGLVDDPNRVFFPDATAIVYLQSAYNEFKSKVATAGSEEVFGLTYQPPLLTAAATLNLNNVLFGATPTQTRCQRILRVIEVDATTGALKRPFEPAVSFESLAPISGPVSYRGARVRWYLDGRTLRFSEAVSGTIQIVYMPDDTVDWTGGVVTGSTKYVDDLGQFHDIIAMLAAMLYYSKDASGNPTLEKRLARRLEDMQDFFARGRSGDGSRYVRDEAW